MVEITQNALNLSLRPVTVGSGRAVGELLPFTFPFGR